MVTGESLPVEKKAGDTVIGATLNKTGTFRFEATKVGKDTVLAQIIRLVQEAQGSKPAIARMVDVIASYFVPVVICTGDPDIHRLGPLRSTACVHLCLSEFHCRPDYRLPLRPRPRHANLHHGGNRQGS